MIKERIDYVVARSERLLIRIANNSRPVKGCWLWTGETVGSRNCENRYPRMNCRIKNKHTKLLAHVVSYVAFNGGMVFGFQIDHKCRNTLCVNPEHLEQVTHGENQHRRAVAYWDSRIPFPDGGEPVADDDPCPF